MTMKIKLRVPQTLVSILFMDLFPKCGHKMVGPCHLFLLSPPYDSVYPQCINARYLPIWQLTYFPRRRVTLLVFNLMKKETGKSI